MLHFCTEIECLFSSTCRISSFSQVQTFISNTIIDLSSKTYNIDMYVKRQNWQLASILWIVLNINNSLIRLLE